MTSSWMGIDLGTQGVRVVVVSSEGVTLGEGTSPLRGRRSDGRHEQDPESWWRAVTDAVRRAGPAAGEVSGLAVDGTSGTLTLLDRAGGCMAAGLMYDDARAAEQTDRVNRVGADQWAAAGYRRMQRSWALPKLLWLLEQHPEAARQGWRLAHQSDVVTRRLVGHEVATDTSNALKTGVDAAGVRWPLDLMEGLGVPEAMLPPVVSPGTLLGEVCPQAADLTGLRPGTPVMAGMTDGCAAQIGAGAVEVGSWNSVLGTTLVLKGVTVELIRDPAGVVYSHRSPTGHWLPGGASSVGAALVARELGDVDDALTAWAGRSLPTAVLRYPLGSVGERFPFVAPDARGFTLGTPSGRGEELAALMQGAAYLERLSLDYLEQLGAPVDGRLILTGGATRNPVWNQLRADVLHRPVELPANAQPALGMAILAAAGVRVGGSGLSAAAAAMVRTDHVLKPRDNDRAAHDAGYLRMVTELEQRGWLPPSVAEHARERSNA